MHAWTCATFASNWGRIHIADPKLVLCRRDYPEREERTKIGNQSLHLARPPNEYNPVVNIENLPNPPYGGTSRATDRQRIGDDLSASDPMGNKPMGTVQYREFTTPIPWNREATTVIGGMQRSPRGGWSKR